MFECCRIGVACAVVLSCSFAVEAEVVLSDPADAHLIAISPPVIQTDTWGSEVGVNGGILHTTVFPVRLPTIPPGMQITRATFHSQVLRNFTTTGYNVDLYGLPPRAIAAVLATDHFAGANDPAAVRIEDDYLRIDNTDVLSYVNVPTSESAEATLIDYLNDAYDTVGPGGYVFFRLSIDSENAPNLTSYFVRMHEWPGFEDAERPHLNLTFDVPTPGPAALGAIALVFSTRRRR